MTSNQLNRGVTLTEALVVLGLIALMTLVAVPQVLKSLQSYRVSEAANQMAVHLRFTRNASVQRKINFRFVVSNKDASVLPNTYTVVYDPTRTNNFVNYPDLKNITLPTDVKILDSTGYSNPTATINFTPRGSANAGDINLQGVDSGLQYRLDVRLTGAVTVTKVGG